MPAFALQQAGLEVGPSVEHFEIRAALSAIQTVLELDQTHRLLRVFTDSEIALLFLQHAAQRDLLPPRKSFHQVRVLYDLAVALAARRRVVPMKVKRKRAEHVECHRRAAKRMRDEFAADPALAWRLAFRKEEDRRDALVTERAALQIRLEALEEEALLIATRMHALQQVRPESIPAQQKTGRYLAF